MKTKLSAEQAAQVIAQAPVALRHLSHENTQLKEKVAFYEKRERVEKVASEMQAKGLDPDTTYDEKVQRLMGSEPNKLDVIEEAVGMSAQQVKVAALSDRPGMGASAEQAFFAAISGE